MLYSVLLAGGLSSRMGRDKSKLKFNELSLLEHSLEILNSCGTDRILISGDIEGYDCVPDLMPQCGPLGGLYSSLKFIKTEFGLDDSRILIIPVDMPMLDTHALAKIIVGASEFECCHYENEIFPCVMRASSSLYSYLEELFSEGIKPGSKGSMKGLMKHFGAKSLNATGLKENVFLNVNSPDEWESFVSEHSSDHQK